MKTRTRRRFLMIALMIVVVSTLSLTGAALAQSSANYDLGCWGVFTAGGREAVSSNNKLHSSFGQYVSGENKSSNYTLRTGYIQNWNPATSGETPEPPDGAYILYMPLIGNSVVIARTCS